MEAGVMNLRPETGFSSRSGASGALSTGRSHQSLGSLRSQGLRSASSSRVNSAAGFAIHEMGGGQGELFGGHGRTRRPPGASVVGKLASGAVPGYTGYVPGKIAENV